MQERIDLKTFRVRDLIPIWDCEATQDYLVEGLIPTSSVTMLSGESGSGKSTVSLALASAVSQGEPFLGRACKKSPVLIVDRENGLTVYSERFRRLDIQPNPDLLFWGHFSQVEPQGPDAKAILEFAAEEKPLIIFDSFVAFHTGNEQDATETRSYTDMYRRLAGVGATVLIIHHTGKGENTKEYRGSSDIKASLDVGLVLTAKKALLKHLVLKPFKSREGVLEPISITLEGEKLVLLDSSYIEPQDKDWITVCESITKAPGLNQSQLLKMLPDISIPKIRKILMAGETNGTFRVEKGPRNASFYYPGEPRNAR